MCAHKSVGWGVACTGPAIHMWVYTCKSCGLQGEGVSAEEAHLDFEKKEKEKDELARNLDYHNHRVSSR